MPTIGVFLRLGHFLGLGLALGAREGEYDVLIFRDGEEVKGVKVVEIAFTTLCHPDICQASVRVIGSVRVFEIGDNITIGPTPVNKLLIRGEVYGKDEISQTLLISTYEMISLPKKPIRHYMSSPLITLKGTDSIADAIRLFTTHHIHGAPVMEDNMLAGIVTMSDIAKAIGNHKTLDEKISAVMTTDVVRAPSTVQLFEVIRRFKEREIASPEVLLADLSRYSGWLTYFLAIRQIFMSLTTFFKHTSSSVAGRNLAGRMYPRTTVPPSLVGNIPIFAVGPPAWLIST